MLAVFKAGHAMYIAARSLIEIYEQLLAGLTHGSHALMNPLLNTKPSSFRMWPADVSVGRSKPILTIRLATTSSLA